MVLAPHRTLPRCAPLLGVVSASDSSDSPSRRSAVKVPRVRGQGKASIGFCEVAYVAVSPVLYRFLLALSSAKPGSLY